MNFKEEQERIREKLKETQTIVSLTIKDAIEKLAIGKNIEKQTQNIQKSIESTVKLILQALDVPTRKEINDLEKKLDALAAKLAKKTRKTKKTPPKNKPE